MSRDLWFSVFITSSLGSRQSFLTQTAFQYPLFAQRMRQCYLSPV